MALGVTIATIFAPEFVMAQSKQEAALIVRVQELEDSVRTLTGQVEELQHSLQVMQAAMQKMQDDNEYRFQELEGGAGKKSDAATQSSGAKPAGALPQAKTPDTQSLPAPAPLSSETSTEPSDGLGDSQDPLVGKGGAAGSAALGTLPAGQDGQALNLNVDPSQPISNGDADAQYKAGYDAITRGDYAFAEDQFRQFIALYPKDAQAPDATNWLAEALLRRGAFDEAADVLATGLETYKKSPREPQMLLNLGIAFAGAGEIDGACRTFFELGKRYPNQPAAFMQRLQQEKSKAQCPV